MKRPSIIAAAVALLAFISGSPPAFHASSAIDRTLIAIWSYPTNVNLREFIWDLYGSSDLQTWLLEQTNLGPSDVVVHATNQFRFYRMKGRN